MGRVSTTECTYLPTYLTSTDFRQTLLKSGGTREDFSVRNVSLICKFSL